MILILFRRRLPIYCGCAARQSSLSCLGSAERFPVIILAGHHTPPTSTTKLCAVVNYTVGQAQSVRLMGGWLPAGPDHTDYFAGWFILVGLQLNTPWIKYHFLASRRRRSFQSESSAITALSIFAASTPTRCRLLPDIARFSFNYYEFTLEATQFMQCTCRPLFAL